MNDFVMFMSALLQSVGVSRAGDWSGCRGVGTCLPLLHRDILGLQWTRRGLGPQACGLYFAEHVKGIVLQLQPGSALATLDL